jgi:hypothetical protein
MAGLATAGLGWTAGAEGGAAEGGGALGFGGRPRLGLGCGFGSTSKKALMPSGWALRFIADMAVLGSARLTAAHELAVFVIMTCLLF